MKCQAGWSQAGMKISGENMNNLRYADDTTFMAESEDELKGLLRKVKEESEKAGLKLSVQKTKILATSLITLWQIDGETMETMTDFIFLISKITADGDLSHETKRCLLLGNKAMTNLDSISKSRDITLQTEVQSKLLCHLVKAMVCPVVMYGCDSWTIKKVEQWRLLILNCGVENILESLGLQGYQASQSSRNPEYSLEGLMLNLKLQYFGHLMQRTESMEKTLMLGKIKSRRSRGW